MPQCCSEDYVTTKLLSKRIPFPPSIPMSSNIDPTDYQMQRASFIDEGTSLRREFLSAHLRSVKEIDADRIVRKIRALEAETIWKQDHPTIPHPFPGMEFLTGGSFFTTFLWFSNVK